MTKRTIQTHPRGRRAPRPRGQTWAAFLHNHAHAVWACDFLPVTDLRFRPHFACFVVELGTRRVVHVGTTRHPTDTWVAQQLREATPFDQRPRSLIRDNDGKFGPTFARVAEASGITILRTPARAPQANAARECLDHVLILGERHLNRVLREYVVYFNQAQPHQALGQALPASPPVEEVQSPIEKWTAMAALPG